MAEPPEPWRDHRDLLGANLKRTAAFLLACVPCCFEHEVISQPTEEVVAKARKVKLPTRTGRDAACDE
jgi:hypothetical protein